MGQLIRTLLYISLLGLPFLAGLPMDIQAAGSEVYRTTDANGNVVFSDQKSDEAEVVELKEPSTYRVESPPPGTREPSTAENSKKGPLYSLLSITSPTDNSTIRDNSGNLQVAFRVEPAIKKSHSVNLLIDGAIWQTSRSAGPMQLSNVDRGTHSILVQVTDKESGEILISSSSISVTVLRAIAPRKSPK